MADAIRFVSAGGGSTGGLLYVHTDHLGTPQKMTDGTQAVVWDAIYTPFGESHSITGTASNQQRFPGQYSDAESGFSYNYFRDYDPTIGRYVESDPIGFDGQDLNLYRYVFSNPINFVDPFGTNPLVVPIGIAIGEAIVDVVIGLGAATAIVELGNQALENRGQGQGKGERGQSGTPAATDNPFKHIKPHPTDPGKVIQTDPHTGQDTVKETPPG